MSASGQAAGQRAPSDTRRRIEEEALRLFLNRSFAGASVRDLAHALGLTTAALYYHYPSKDDMLVSVVTPFLSDSASFLGELEAAVEHPSFYRKALEAYYDLIAGHLEVFRLISTDASVRAHPGIAPELGRQSSRFWELLTGGDRSHGRQLRVAAALGALRRPMRLANADLVADRDAIVEGGLRALGEVSPRR